MGIKRKIYTLYSKLISPLAPNYQYVTTVEVVTLGFNELLVGKTALITGGTSGIGKAIASAFLRSGARVVITGRSQEKINSVCRELNNDGTFLGKVFGVCLDTTNVETFPLVLQNVLEVLNGGKLDILVNSAGIIGGSIFDSTEQEFDRVIDTNLKGVVFLTRIVTSYMIKNGIKGNVLNIASSSSLRPAISAYILSKWGIKGLTLGQAKALIPYGIVVNGLAPGPTATPMLMTSNDNLYNEKNPSRRYSSPEEMANLAVVLVSGMGRMIVGDIIYATGGAGLVTFDDINYQL